MSYFGTTNNAAKVPGSTPSGGGGGAGAGGFFNVAASPQRMNAAFAIDHEGINLKVIKANGGWVIQVYQMNDSISGEYKKPELHIIPNDLEFDKELGKIIVMSCLKG